MKTIQKSQFIILSLLLSFFLGVGYAYTVNVLGVDFVYLMPLSLGLFLFYGVYFLSQKYKFQLRLMLIIGGVGLVFMMLIRLIFSTYWQRETLLSQFIYSRQVGNFLEIMDDNEIDESELKQEFDDYQIQHPVNYKIRQQGVADLDQTLIDETGQGGYLGVFLIFFRDVQFTDDERSMSDNNYLSGALILFYQIIAAIIGFLLGYYQRVLRLKNKGEIDRFRMGDFNNYQAVVQLIITHDFKKLISFVNQGKWRKKDRTDLVICQEYKKSDMLFVFVESRQKRKFRLLKIKKSQKIPISRDELNQIRELL